MESERPLNQRMKAARREQRLSQSDVATAVGCKQSAVSMFETGKTAALADDKLVKICDLLKITPPVSKGTLEAVTIGLPMTTFCPTYDCPSNLPYLVGEELLLLPEPRRTLLANHPHCHYCGEHLEHSCPECGSPVGAGACCPCCGSAYIQTPELGEAAANWVQTQQQRVMLIRPGTIG